MQENEAQQMLEQMMQNGGGEAAAVGGIAIAGIFMFIMVFLLIMLVPMIFYVLTLQKAFKKCSAENQAMSPGLAWLLLVPFVGIIWHFFVVLNMTKSLEAEFGSRGIDVDQDPGKKLGLAMCILACCSGIPFIGTIIAIGGLVCWIMYWVKIAGYSKELDAAAVAA
jgi:hypothetical protein